MVRGQGQQTGETEDRPKERRLASIRFLPVAIATVFAVHLILDLATSSALAGLPGLARVIVESLVLIVVLYPVLSVLVVRPLLSEIAQRRRAEEEVRQREVLFRQLAESAEDIVYRYRLVPTRGTEYVGPAVTAITGYTPEEFYADPDLPFRVLCPDNRPLLEAMMRSPASFSGRPVVLQGIRKDGEPFFLELRNVPGNDETGNLVAMQGIAREISERRRAEEAMSRLVAIVESSADAIIGKTLDGVIVTWNPGAERLYGYSTEEIKGQSMKVLVPPDRRDEASRILERVRRGERVEQHETVRLHKDGRRIEVSVTVSPIKDPAGNVIGVSTIARDTSERKLVERALRESEERFRKVFEEGPLGLAIVGLDYRFVKVNARLCQMVGYTEEELMARTFVDITHPEDIDKDVQLAQQLFRGEIPWYAMGKRYFRKNGEIVCINLTGSIIRDEQGTPLYFLATIEDVTERKRVEDERDRLLESERVARAGAEAATEELTRANGQLVLASMRAQELAEQAEKARQESELRSRQLDIERQRLQAILEAVPAGVLLAEADGRIMAINRSAEVLLGRPREQIVAIPPAVDWIRRPTGEPYPLEELPPSLALKRGQPSFGVEVLVGRPDGSTVHLLTNSVPITDPEGQVTAAVVAFVDITPIRELERQREEFISIVAHDLRGAITPTLGFADLLMRLAAREELSEMAQRALSAIAANSRRLARMTDDLLDVSRLEARRLMLEKKPIELPALMRAIVERLEELTRGHSVRVEVPGEVPSVMADPDRIEQVLTNLLSNAGKYSYPDSPITIEVEPRAGEVQIALSNCGPGIAPDDRDKIFTRFHRTPQAREERAPGLGLGLYIAKGLIEAHGGRIWVESEPGAQTTFWFSLPVGDRSDVI